MNDIQDVLHQHAEAVVDHAHPARVAAVRRRVRVVRRRRTAVAAAAAVLVVAVGAVAIAIPRHDGVTPAGRPSRLAGHAVPRATVSLGARYVYSQGVAGSHGKVSLALPPSATRDVVRMASADTQGELVLGLTGAPNSWISPAGAFGTFFQVPPGDATRLSVTQRAAASPGEVAVAVYRLATVAAGSYVKDGISYPPEVAGQPLLGASIGDPGVSSQTVRLKASPVMIDVHAVCGGFPKGVGIRVSFVGRTGFIEEGGGCQGAASALPAYFGDSSSLSLPRGARAIKIEAIDSTGHPVALPPTARLGVGIYTSNRIGAEHDLPRVVDVAGHRWQLARVDLAPKGQRDLTTTMDGRRPTLVAYGASTSSRGTVVTTVAGEQTAQLSGGGVSQVIVANDRPDAVIRLHLEDPHPQDQLLVGTYSLID